MGEIADAMIDGDMCQQCGQFIEDGPGYPTLCSDCRLRNSRTARPIKPVGFHEFKGSTSATNGCSVCSRKEGDLIHLPKQKSPSA